MKKYSLWDQISKQSKFICNLFVISFNGILKLLQIAQLILMILFNWSRMIKDFGLLFLHFPLSGWFGSIWAV